MTVDGATLICDLECDGLVDDATKIWVFPIIDVTQPNKVQSYSDEVDYLPSIAEGIDRLSKAKRIIFHNGLGYDYLILQKFYPNKIKVEQIWDTMVVAALLEPSRRSVALASFGEEFKFEKGDFNDFSRFSKEMVTYAERDALLTCKLYTHLQSKLRTQFSLGVDYRRSIDLEHKVQQALVAQNQHGFNFDIKNAELLSAKLSQKVFDLEQQLGEVFVPIIKPNNARWCYKARTWKSPEIFTPKVTNKQRGYQQGAQCVKAKIEPFNPSSREQIAIRLSHLYGWIPTEYTNDGRPKCDEAVLKKLTQWPEVQLLLDYFKTSKQLAQLCEGKFAWLKLHRNGRMHGYVRSCGARTHRMSHARPNMAQCDKAKYMRSLWIPDEDHILIGCDADALELRLLACYLYQFDKGAYAETVLYGKKEDGTDPHSLNQRLCGLESRDIAKAVYYALIYSAGDGKLGAMYANDQAEAKIKIYDESEYRELGKTVRNKLETGIKGLSALLHAVDKKASRNKFVKLPDGRAAETAPRTALNTLLQGAGAVLMKQALVIFYHELMPKANLTHGIDYALVANVHDEQQITCKKEYADVVGQAFADAIRMAGEFLKLPVPFSGEYKKGKSWAETH